MSEESTTATPKLPVIDPTYDSSFKYVFATEGESEPILASLLNDVLHLDRDKAIKTLIYKNVEQVIDRDGGRGLILDLLVTDQHGRSYNVEIQRSDTSPVITRGVYHGAKKLAGQLGESEGYDKLRPVIVVFICNYSTFPDDSSVRNLGMSAYAVDASKEERQLGTQLSDFDPAIHKRYHQLKGRVQRSEPSFRFLQLYLVELDKPNPQLSERQRAWLYFLLSAKPDLINRALKLNTKEDEMYDVVDGDILPHHASPETIEYIDAARERLKRFAADPEKRMQYDSEDLARI